MRSVGLTAKVTIGGAMAALLVAAPAAHAVDFPADGPSLGAIPDGAAGCAPSYGAPLNVTFTVAGVTGPLTDVGASFTNAPIHAWMGDIEATLIAPDGVTQHKLFELTGSTTASGDGEDANLLGTYAFSDSSPTSWWTTAIVLSSATTMPSGTYRTVQPGGAGSTGALTSITPAFAGLANPNGTWTLRFRDACEIDATAITAATLSLTGAGDVTPPTAPALTSTNPASPANDNSPRVIGTAEAGSTVKLYSTANCTGPQLGSDTAANLAAPGVQINVADNTTTQIYGTATDAATNVSPCSAAISYQEVTPPAAPTLASTNPASPANNNTPRVIGAAAPGTTVRLYSGNNCTGTPLATGPAADLATPGLQITVADNSTTQIRATATQGVNNTSACSAALSYQELTPATKDTTPPKTTITKSPKAKTKSKTATFEFGADEAGVTFQCKLEGKKVKAPLNEFATCTSPQTYKKLKPGKKTFTVHATDAAGNLGADAVFSWKVKKKRK